MKKNLPQKFFLKISTGGNIREQSVYTHYILKHNITLFIFFLLHYKPKITTIPYNSRINIIFFVSKKLQLNR